MHKHSITPYRCDDGKAVPRSFRTSQKGTFSHQRRFGRLARCTLHCSDWINERFRQLRQALAFLYLKIPLHPKFFRHSRIGSEYPCLLATQLTPVAGFLKAVVLHTQDWISPMFCVGAIRLVLCCMLYASVPCRRQKPHLVPVLFYAGKMHTPGLFSKK